MTLSYAFVAKVFVTGKLIYNIDNMKDPYQKPSAEQPRY